MNSTTDSAMGRITPLGVLYTATLLSVQADTSMLSYPTPHRPIAQGRSTPVKDCRVIRGFRVMRTS